MNVKDSIVLATNMVTSGQYRDAIIVDITTKSANLLILVVDMVVIVRYVNLLL